ncbi:hypothetical protein, partial [Nocardia brasiliensis]|uniref:hypothetical protein n=1 Tax=Nocardia brasiliensis TaxID=37326 RepID=UPI0033C080AE
PRTFQHAAHVPARRARSSTPRTFQHAAHVPARRARSSTARAFQHGARTFVGKIVRGELRCARQAG